MADKIQVHITVDTETSMGGAWANAAFEPLSFDLPVFGKLGPQFYGIPLIMDILEEHGFHATFFTEVFCSYVIGSAEVAKACGNILERGHDCQLHTHPIYLFYWRRKQGKPAVEMDYFHALSPDLQSEFIGEAVRLFRGFTGQKPKAYRAGCYAGSEDVVAVLEENGISIDSSYNLAYLGQTCGFQRIGLNAPVRMGSVHEFPVTVFRVAGVAGYKPLEISAVSVNEIMTSIEMLRQAGCNSVVLVLHSFSLLKNLGTRFERCMPDNIVIQRLRKLCVALAERSDTVHVCPLAEVDFDSLSLPQPQTIPVLGWREPAMRKLIQAANRLPWI